jgi:hypothetical protein
MDLSKINGEDIKKMSESELRDYVRELIRADSEEQPELRAAFLGPNGEHVSLNVLVEQMGEDAVVELIAKMFSESSGVKCHAITKEDYDAMVEKVARGEELSDEERKIFEVVSAELNGNMMEYQKHTLAAMLHIIDFAQNEAGYDPSLVDLGILLHMMTVETLTNSPDTRLNMYKGGDLSVPMQMSQAMAEDILNTWRATLTEKPDQGTVILALASALIGEIISYEKTNHKRLTLPPIDYLRKATGIEEDEEECNCDCCDDECQCGDGECQCGGEDCHCKDETENGSNDGKVVSFDEMMRKMLKE